MKAIEWFWLILAMTFLSLSLSMVLVYARERKEPFISSPVRYDIENVIVDSSGSLETIWVREGNHIVQRSPSMLVSYAHVLTTIYPLVTWFDDAKETRYCIVKGLEKSASLASPEGCSANWEIEVHLLHGESPLVTREVMKR